jgi:hypothetical protein
MDENGTGFRYGWDTRNIPFAFARCTTCIVLQSHGPKTFSYFSHSMKRRRGRGRACLKVEVEFRAVELLN